MAKIDKADGECEKPLAFLGKTKEILRDLPKDVMQDIGHQLYLVQCGDNPSNWEPVSRVGQGAMELKVWAKDGTYRVLYVAKFVDAVYVLHVFKKTTPKIPDKEIEVAKANYSTIP